MFHPVMLAVLLLQAPPQGAPVYTNDAYRFQVAIPAGWVQIPDSILHDRVLAMRRRGAPERDTNYPTAFARAPVHDWFAHPFVLVQVNPFAPDRPPPTSLVQVAADLNTLGNTARYDSLRDAVLVAGPRVAAAGGIAIRSYSAIRMGQRGLVSVMAYALEEDSTGTAAIRDRFLAGLRVDSLAQPPR